MGDAAHPASIIYMSLNFDQTKDCRLSHATVSIILQEYNLREGAREAPVVSKGLHITDKYGPKQLFGKERKMLVKKNAHLTPNINLLGSGAGGIGLDRSQDTIYSSRWIFNGRLTPADHPTIPNQHTSVYRKLTWELQETDLKSHTTHNNAIHTAFAFKHEGNPFTWKSR